jgi:hypothetical protein
LTRCDRLLRQIVVVCQVVEALRFVAVVVLFTSLLVLATFANLQADVELTVVKLFGVGPAGYTRSDRQPCQLLVTDADGFFGGRVGNVEAHEHFTTLRPFRSGDGSDESEALASSTGGSGSRLAQDRFVPTTRQDVVLRSGRIVFSSIESKQSHYWIPLILLMM